MGIAGRRVQTCCVYSGRTVDLTADAVVLVTARCSNEQLWQDLQTRADEWAPAGIQSVTLIGDAEAPAPIAWATYAGHHYARTLDAADGR